MLLACCECDLQAHCVQGLLTTMVLDENGALGVSLRGLFCVFPAQERDEHVVDQDGFY